MLRTSSLLVTASSLLFIMAGNVAADSVTPTTPVVGEVKAVVMDPTNGSEVRALRQQGWVHAGGQLVSIQAYPALYRTIGRKWTSPQATNDQFALPDLDPGHDQRTPDPYGVLGGDAVIGGKQLSEAHAPSLRYFIYVGQQGK